MRKIRLTREERAIEDSIEQYIPVDKSEYNEIIAAISARKKDAVLNIRVNSYDLTNIKRKAQQLGIKYQTLISEVLHRMAQTN